MLRGFNDETYIPHSRYTTVLKEDINKVDELELLLYSEESVITSYSIHYTKLYEKVLDKVEKTVETIPSKKRPKVYYAEGVDGLATECVITSYSIHYTKLYEKRNLYIQYV